MTTRATSWPAGSPCWADCSVQPAHRGIHRAHDFYRKLFGWHLEDGPADEGNYTVALKDEFPAAALMEATEDEGASSWTVYFATDDIAATCAAVTRAGGSVAAGPMEIPGAGSAAYCLDPQGAPFGLWQGGDLIGFGISGEPGSFGWAGLITSDLESAKAFYAAVFGYSYDAAAGTASAGGVAVARLGDGTAIAQLATNDGGVAGEAAWSPYFAVADRDSSAEIAQELDGALRGAGDCAVGPAGWVESPTGETFRIVALDETAPTVFSMEAAAEAEGV